MTYSFVACAILSFPFHFILYAILTLFFEEVIQNVLRTVQHTRKTESNLMRFYPNFW